ncbi:hypothetical protein FOE78_13300 [Microlunatus elymi]|uniref:Maltokinase N-terminal cap domain-containing protein n=1 Tax=Microlunatus elymi TaxID=2596828 RepID=A0A516PZZ9_9ACTN|nr:hypothetical protein [Microlunatus elymi]QDP96753.1 hypothetical protein FOE78_13300 [Microlunatus elymi]
MAIIHKATLTPSKPEVLRGWLDRQPWGGSGEIEQVAGYRFDNPAGEVGVEGFVLRRGDRLLHAVLTYRGEPQRDGQGLIATMQHSVLGRRWVYDAATDPVALGCFLRAVRGEQDQAALELWDGDRRTGLREQTLRLLAQDGSGPDTPDGYDGPDRQDEFANPDASTVVRVAIDGGELRIARVLGIPVDGSRRLTARWDGGSAVLAALR